MGLAEKFFFTVALVGVMLVILCGLWWASGVVACLASCGEYLMAIGMTGVSLAVFGVVIGITTGTCVDCWRKRN
jgi:membrane associated rhomboid family serine protease